MLKRKEILTRMCYLKRFLVMELIDVKDTQIQRDVKTETYKYSNAR